MKKYSQGEVLLDEEQKKQAAKKAFTEEDREALDAENEAVDEDDDEAE